MPQNGMVNIIQIFRPPVNRNLHFPRKSRILPPGAGFAADTNVVTVLRPGSIPERPHIEHWQKMSKRNLAERMLTELAGLHVDVAGEQGSQES